MGGTIHIERRGAVALLTLSNPDKRNAIAAPMWEQLKAFGEQTATDRDCRAVVIAGEGAVFSAGADIGGFDAGRSGAAAIAYDDLVEAALRALEAMPQTTIAAIIGPCMGAGASLAAACDFRVADSSAFFAVPAARLGLGYDPRGIARFVRVFGEPASRELLLLAERIAATRAHGFGAVHRLAADGEAAALASSLAETAAARAPLTIMAAKAALRDIASRYEPSAEVRRLADRADRSEDYVEGRAAFAGKRPPRFSGT